MARPTPVTPTTTSWVPTDACSLPTVDRPLRLAEFDTLFASALRSVERPGTTWLQLRLADDDGVHDHVQDLAAREGSCCGFFEFAVHRDADEVVLDVRVPAARAEVLDGLAQQATTAGARAGR